MKSVVLIITAFILSACQITGDSGPQGPRGIPGPGGTNGINGHDGATGPAGSNGTNGSDGATGPAGVNGVDGVNGTNGHDGVDATPITIVQFCQGITPAYPSTFPEIGLCLQGKLYGVYSTNGGFMVYISDGSYISHGLNADCTFVVSGCEVH